MTVTARTSVGSARESGNGSKDAFDFAFKLFLETDVKVFKIDTTTDPETQTLQALGTDYTVAFDTDAETGTVTFTTPPTEDEDSYIVREVDNGQEMVFETGEPFNSSSLMHGLDKLTILVQDAALAASPTLVTQLNALVAAATALVESAAAVEANNIVQANMASGSGVVTQAASAPSDTDALWYDTGNNVLKKYNTGTAAWDIVRDKGTALTMSDISDIGDLPDPTGALVWTATNPSTAVLAVAGGSTATWANLDLTSATSASATWVELSVFVKDTTAVGIGMSFRVDAGSQTWFTAVTNFTSSTRGTIYTFRMPMATGQVIQHSREAGGAGTFGAEVHVLAYGEPVA